MASITAPWSTDVSGLLSEPLRHVIEVRANHTSWPAPIPLDIESGTVNYSETQSPFISADMALRVPPTQAELDLLDPRQGVVIEIDAGYVLPDGTRDVHRLANLYLWDRVVKRPDNLVQLSARSMESRLIEWMPLGASKSFTFESDAGAAIKELIQWALPSAPVTNILPKASFVTGADIMAVGTGDNVMRAIFDIADRAGDGWVYEDGLGTWHVKPRPKFAGLSAAQLRTAINGTITRSDATLSLEDWYNSVLVEHRWYDGEQRTAQGWAEVTSGSLSVAAVGRRTLKITREYTGSAATAKSAASALVARTISRGRAISVEVGSAPYWIRPGSTVTIQLPTGTQERHLVTDVQFDLAGSGTANINTRLPENVTILTGE